MEALEPLIRLQKGVDLKECDEEVVLGMGESVKVGEVCFVFVEEIGNEEGIIGDEMYKNEIRNH